MRKNLPTEINNCNSLNWFPIFSFIINHIGVNFHVEGLISGEEAIPDTTTLVSFLYQGDLEYSFKNGPIRLL